MSILEEFPLDPSETEDVEFLGEERTPARLVRLACAAHASAASLSECSDLLAWFSVDRTRQAVWYWYRAYGDYHDQEFTAEPEYVAVDEKQVQLAEGVLGSTLRLTLSRKSCVEHDFLPRRGTKSATQFLRELKEKHRVADAEFLVDGMGYLTAIERTDLSGDLNYSERNIVETLFQTFTMRLGRFHEIWNGSQANAERWLTTYTAYYNHFYTNSTSG